MESNTDEEFITGELRGLTETGLWAAHYELCRAAGADKLAAEAGRFRDALRGAGTDCSVEEVRRALLQQAGFDEAARSVETSEAARGSSAEPADGQRPENRAPAGNVVQFPSATAGDQRDAGSGSVGSGDPRAASLALHRLYADGGRIELRDGELFAGRHGGLGEDHRALLREHKEGLKHLLSQEATSQIWSPAVRHVARALGDELEGARYERAVGFLDEAQDAYERGDNGLCRYLLQRAALAARERPSEGQEQGTKEETA